MKGKIIWIEKRYYYDGQVRELPRAIDWTIKEEEPLYDNELYDKYILIPLEDD